MGSPLSLPDFYTEMARRRPPDPTMGPAPRLDAGAPRAPGGPVPGGRRLPPGGFGTPGAPASDPAFRPSGPGPTGLSMPPPVRGPAVPMGVSMPPAAPAARPAVPVPMGVSMPPVSPVVPPLAAPRAPGLVPHGVSLPPVAPPAMAPTSAPPRAAGPGRRLTEQEWRRRAAVNAIYHER